MSKTLVRQVAVLLLLLMTALVPAQEASARTPLQHRPIRGEDLFRGIMMGDGPIAKRLPELTNEYNAELEKTIQALYPDNPIRQQEVWQSIGHSRNDLIARIAAVQPGFFEEFRRNVTSGDPLVVEPALAQGVRLLATAANDVLREELAKEDLRPEDVQSGAKNYVGEKSALAVEVAVVAVAVLFELIAVHGVSVVNIAQYVNLTVAYNQALIYDEVRFMPNIAGSDDKSRLQKEMWIGLIAERLAGVS